MRDKSVFLLLRGLAREQRHWDDFKPLLQQHFPETTILTLDIPGNGHLYQSDSPTTIAGMTDALREQLVGLDNPPYPLNLIALSMGGMIAIDWMTRYPHEIASAVLINSSVGHFAPYYQRLRWQNYAGILRLCWQTPAAREQFILMLTSNHQPHNLDLLARWQYWQQQYPLSWRNVCRQMFAAAGFKSPQKPLQPILIVTSPQDRLVSYQCSLKLQQAWQCAFELHLSAGHDLPLDDPAWLVAVIKAWLARVQP